MRTFFTSDTHFHHANIIKYCNRPFRDTAEMNNTIITNWNAKVGGNDLIYHLGDFAFGREDWHLTMLLEKLKGKIIFLKGNHDRLAWRNRQRFFACSDSYREIEVNGQEITLCHYALRVWNKSHHGAWHLYGHSHGTLPDDPHSRSFDCGVDSHNFTPLSFEEVKVIMDKKLWKPIDHHGERQEGGGVGLSAEDYAKADRKRQYEQLKKEFEL
jgi:calcineurin-like phosphoesterase family protein